MNFRRRVLWSCLANAGLGFCLIGCSVENPRFIAPQPGADNPLTPGSASGNGVVTVPANGTVTSVAPNPASSGTAGSLPGAVPPPGASLPPSAVSPGAVSPGAVSPGAVSSTPPPAGCGDGVFSPATEQCDNGATNSNVLPNACRTNCLAWTCGDGVIDSGESCDDGAGNGDADGVRCRRDCQLARCGDGITDVAVGEVCDEGAANSDVLANACRTSCTRAACGDGVRDASEACDNGVANADGEDSPCTTQCLSRNCGNGVLDADEGCDEGAGNSDAVADACRKSCQRAACGDGIIDTDEACDDGPNNSDTTADACRRDCSEATCGDGIQDSGEECDGQLECTNECVLADCGNGVTEGTEQCDGEDDCRDDCIRANCGNGTVEGLEQCDGGQNCTNACTSIVCGDNKVEGTEACDEGRANSAQGACTPECRRTFCGDGIKQATEDCDDGQNTATYYGCAAGCNWAPSCGDGQVQSAHEECDGGNTCNDECKKLPSKLQAGDRLNIGDELAEGSLRLEVKDNGDVELRSNGNKVWNANTSGSDGYLTMQGDGNCVIYMGGTSVWSTGTRNGDVLSLENNTLVIKEGSRVIKQIYPVLPTSDHLDVNQRLYAGTGLAAGGTTLVMQGDGNVLVKKDGTTQWKTSTQGNTGAFMVLQGDGNIVVRDTGGEADWSSGTRNGTTLKLTADSLRLLDGPDVVKQFWPEVVKTTLNSGERLYAGSELTAGDLRLYIQGDGNLLLKEGSTTRWKTSTTNSAGAYAEMRSGGYLAVISNETEIWSSETTDGRKLVLESGSLTIQNNSGSVVLSLWPEE